MTNGLNPNCISRKQDRHQEILQMPYTAGIRRSSYRLRLNDTRASSKAGSLSQVQLKICRFP